MNRSYLLLLLACALLVPGCDGGDGGSGSGEKPGHVWSEQTDAIEKAKDVDQVIQQAADRQRQAIDEQSN